VEWDYLMCSILFPLFLYLCILANFCILICIALFLLTRDMVDRKVRSGQQRSNPFPDKELVAMQRWCAYGCLVSNIRLSQAHHMQPLPVWLAAPPPSLADCMQKAPLGLARTKRENRPFPQSQGTLVQLMIVSTHT
jgi:hypothetical protein